MAIPHVYSLRQKSWRKSKEEISWVDYLGLAKIVLSPYRGITFTLRTANSSEESEYSKCPKFSREVRMAPKNQSKSKNQPEKAVLITKNQPDGHIVPHKKKKMDS